MSRTRLLRRRYLELAGMFKRVKQGTNRKLDRIIGKFALQEGVKEVRAMEYVELFNKAGLLSFTRGHKKWKYHPEAETDLFNVNV